MVCFSLSHVILSPGGGVFLLPGDEAARLEAFSVHPSEYGLKVDFLYLTYFCTFYQRQVTIS